MNYPDILDLHPQLCRVRVKPDEGISLLVFFDLETTGFGIYQVQILEFGMVGALSVPGQPLRRLGDYSSYLACDNMRFPEDITALTGIKNVFHEGSQLKDQPTLPVVNELVLKKIVEWKKVTTHARAQHSYTIIDTCIPSTTGS